MSGGVNPFSRSHVSKIQKRQKPRVEEHGSVLYSLYILRQLVTSVSNGFLQRADIVRFAKKEKKSLVVKLIREDDSRESRSFINFLRAEKMRGSIANPEISLIATGSRDSPINFPRETSTNPRTRRGSI